MNVHLLYSVEEILQRKHSSCMTMSPSSFSAQKVSPEIAHSIAERQKRGAQEESLYDVIVRNIHRLHNPNFYKKNGDLNEAAFYRYAYIDKSTWSELHWGLTVPKKKTLLKLVIALHLNEEDASDLLHRGASSFDPKDLRDQIILALIELKCYDPGDVYDVLEEYRLHGTQKFENIY